MAYFIAILHQDPGTDYGLCFPDFPGCVAAENNLEGLKAAAEEALAGHLQLLAEAERQALASTLAHDPTQGDRLVQGSGIRKLRFARGGRGKSGGIRVVYFYHSPRMPLFLLTLFAKNERDNLKPSEVRILGEAAKALARRYGDRR